MKFNLLYRRSVNLAGFLVRLGRFAAIIFVFFVAYRLLLQQTFDGSKQVLPIFGLWILSAYIALPRAHRFLTKYYLPNYFVGRIRSPSGLLSDPVNLAFFGKADNIHQGMIAAGWTKADDLTLQTFMKAAYSILFHKSYPNAPVGNMFLFSRKQDFAYQIEMNGSPNERHHVRFWRTKKSWRLPGGHEVDWLAAATYDTHVGLKAATGQIDHLIHENVDVERDFIVSSLKHANVVSKVDVVKHFSDAYHDHNNGGDRIKTDGSLPFIHLR